MKFLNKLVIGGLFSVFVLGFLFIYSAKTYALTQQDVNSGLYNFQDSSTITARIGGFNFTFTDSNPVDSNHNFRLSNAGNGVCSGDITVKDSSIFTGTQKVGTTTASLDIGLGNSGIVAGSCGAGSTSFSTNISVGKLDSAGNGSVLDGLTFVSQVEIKSDKGLSFQRKDPKSLILTRVGESTGALGQTSTVDNPAPCGDLLFLDSATGPGLMIEFDVGDRGVKVSKLISSSNPSAKSLADKILRVRSNYNNCSVQRVNNLGGTGFDSNDIAGVGIAANTRIAISDPTVNGKKASQLTADEAKALSDQAAGEAADNCVATDSGPLGWILCPVLSTISGATNLVFQHIIIPFLEEVPVSLNSQDGTYIAWKQFRLIGNIVLVGTMIAVVYAQVRGGKN